MMNDWIKLENYNPWIHPPRCALPSLPGSRPNRLLFRICLLVFFSGSACMPSKILPPKERLRLLESANRDIKKNPEPITLFYSPRSEGTPNDYFSEGDYWWPNPADPEGPYIRRDGWSNPSNFNAHRVAMYQLSRIVSTLTVAYLLTGEERYALHALKHLNTWFVAPDTRMNPHLRYAQAIQGVASGRGIGIIDTIHLIEVARCVKLLEQYGFGEGYGIPTMKAWFASYADWLTTHSYGWDERNNGNNHSTWWVAQLAAFADVSGRDDLLQVARSEFKKNLDAQMDDRGAFPQELARTKPYNYSIFNLEGFATIAQIASTKSDDLWNYPGKNGSLRKAWEFMIPYLRHKQTWPFPPDLQYFDQLPVQTCGLLFAYQAYHRHAWLKTWKNLPSLRQSEEIDRVNPLRQPLLWLEYGSGLVPPFF